MNPFASLKAAIILAKSSALSSADLSDVSALSTCSWHRTALAHMQTSIVSCAWAASECFESWIVLWAALHNFETHG